MEQFWSSFNKPLCYILLYVIDSFPVSSILSHDEKKNDIYKDSNRNNDKEDKKLKRICYKITRKSQRKILPAKTLDMNLLLIVLFVLLVSQLSIILSSCLQKEANRFS